MAEISQKSKAQGSRPVTRKIKQPQYKHFRLSKKIKQPKAPLLGGFKLFVLSIRVLLKHKRLFGGVFLVCLLLNILLVRGVSNASSITDIKGLLDGVFTGSSGQLTSGAALFAVLLSGAGSAPSEVAGAYQTLLLIISSLAFIWAYRATAGEKPKRVLVRDAFYKSMHPLVPFIAVLVIIGLQLLPLVLGNLLYGIVIGGGFAVTVLEKALWLMLIFLLCLLSLYMVSSSIFALYIVTLNNMKPMQALRSARELVRFRRWSIMRKLILLPILLIVIGAIIIIPLIIINPLLAEWLFYILTLASLPLTHSYLYQLYRKLL